ncbi:hybrid sensor histidine kinase/response regulator [Brumimicrobium aurantiacum]|uniref:histidine kinase n=1 Tax=Brumimicrobium aurantiacum TaxID=1737063 RepID=A0A3E1EW68_9FLAO|nr:hybrid sensor histidine kinase/response regulator [Brumimicrobium aurantiacum]RFC53800.1 response regulator [Brumimicrobium aurantiacum]
MSLKVLIIDDDEDDYVIMSHYLSKIKTEEYDVFWCNDFDLAEQEILKDEHHIYLIDHFLGKGEGIQIIERIRERGILKPMILLTGSSNYAVDEEAMSKGASDFLIKKEVRVDTLERAMRYALERYNQEKNIRAQEKKYRSLFELSLEPFLVLNSNMCVTEYNAAFLDVFHDANTPTQLLQNTCFSQLFKYEFDFNSLKNQLNKDGFVKGFKTTLVNKGVDVVVVLSIAHIPYGTDGDKAYHVAISDLTKLMEQEAELKKVEKMSMSGRMARMIAHEVRNPLTNIRLAVSELSVISSDEDEKSDKKLLEQMIDRNTIRISDLIDDLLKSARPPELELVNTELRKVLDAAIQFCDDRVKLLNVQLTLDYCDDVFEGYWDPEKLKIALVNIIINAIEAMADKENPELLITLTKEGNRPVILIKDNGKGMDEETQTNLFDPFFTKRKDGLGLGMTATLNIINMHKGKVVVNSTEGHGTKFKVTL